MSRGSNGYRQTTYERSGNTESEYIYGNTVRKLEPSQRRKPAGANKRQPSPEVLRNRARARYMSIGYVLFLAAALCAASLVLVNYIQLQTELTNLTRNVASRQVELNNKKMANDEEYNRIVNSIDLEEIKRVALGELGMIYAQEGQIVTYENRSSDYMRQVVEGD